MLGTTHPKTVVVIEKKDGNLQLFDENPYIYIYQTHGLGMKSNSIVAQLLHKKWHPHAYGIRSPVIHKLVSATKCYLYGHPRACPRPNIRTPFEMVLTTTGLPEDNAKRLTTEFQIS